MARTKKTTKIRTALSDEEQSDVELDVPLRGGRNRTSTTADVNDDDSQDGFEAANGEATKEEDESEGENEDDDDAEDLEEDEYGLTDSTQTLLADG